MKKSPPTAIKTIPKKPIDSLKVVENVIPNAIIIIPIKINLLYVSNLVFNSYFEALSSLSFIDLPKPISGNRCATIISKFSLSRL